MNKNFHKKNSNFFQKVLDRVVKEIDKAGAGNGFKFAVLKIKF
jgi:hypothetical protein